MVDIRVEESAESASQVAAGMIAGEIEANPASALIPATGNTPLATYRFLAQRTGEGLDTSRLRVFQLDEYVGVAPGDPRSLYGWMRRCFVDPLHIDERRVTRLRGDAADLAIACAEYERAVSMAGGIDLAILGLGLDGHLGYNEPPSRPDAPTRVVALLPESRATAASYWPTGTPTPERGITAGMNILLAARSIVLLVTGRAKRSILHAVLEGPIGPNVPASYIRLANRATVIADREAMGDA
jgi:glucosamine-6-phosphate deaminase